MSKFVFAFLMAFSAVAWADDKQDQRNIMMFFANG
jgi:hypothetical protein